MIDLAALPDFIRDDDPRFRDAYDQRYEGKTYRLYWSDYPVREESPAVYLLGADKTEGSRVRDETLERAVAEAWWIRTEYRIQNIGRDEVCFPPKTPLMTGAPTGFFAGNMMELAGDKNPLLPEQPQKPDAWTCPQCGQAGNTTKFCPECGAKRP